MPKLDRKNLFVEDINTKPSIIRSFCNTQSPRLFYILFGVIILFSIIILGLIVTLIIKPKSKSNSSSNEKHESICLSNGCVIGSAHQNLFTDSLIKPCDNFFKYACGNWIKTHNYKSFEVEKTIINDIINRIDNEIETLLDAPILRNIPTSWEYKIKTYYQECRDDYSRVSDGGNMIASLIQDASTIKGWYLFDGEDGTTLINNNQTLYEQFEHIQTDLGAHAIFSIRTKDDEFHKSMKRLELYPSGLSMEYINYVSNDDVSNKRKTAYFEYIVEVLATLAQDAGVHDMFLNQRIQTVATDVLDIETQLAYILQKTTGSNGVEEKPFLLTLQEITNQFSFDFTRLMNQALIGPVILDSSTNVYVTNPGYFNDAFKLLQQIDNNRKIHNYMRWRLVQKYIDDLGYQYIHANRVFIEKFYGYPLHMTNEDYCTRETIEKFPLAVIRLYSNFSFHSDNTEIVNKILGYLIDSLSKYITDISWMDEQTKQIANEKIKQLQISVGYTDIASNDDKLDAFYEKLMITADSHFHNAHTFVDFRKTLLADALLNPDKLDHWDTFEQRKKLFDYVPVLNTIFVISKTMQQPLVNHRWPPSLNFGSIGVLLAEKVFSVIDVIEGNSHLPNGTNFDWWSTNSLQLFNQSRQCITNYYTNVIKSLSYSLNGIPVTVELKGEPFSPITLRQIGALRLAHMALNNYMNNNTEYSKNQISPGGNLTTDQQFFLAYAQTQCFKRNDLVQIVKTQLGIYDEETALNTALKHMSEFKNTFNCSSTEPMNAENKCFETSTRK